MYAVMLHREMKPELKKGACVLPIRNWESGKHRILPWLKQNCTHAPGKEPMVRFVTFMRLPDDHPVWVSYRWVDTKRTPQEFKPLSDWERGLWYELDRICMEGPKMVSPQVSFHTFLFRDKHKCKMVHQGPAIILGKPLPKTAVRWTKPVSELVRMDAAAC